MEKLSQNYSKPPKKAESPSGSFNKGKVPELKNLSMLSAKEETKSARGRHNSFMKEITTNKLNESSSYFARSQQDHPDEEASTVTMITQVNLKAIHGEVLIGTHTCVNISMNKINNS